MESLDFNGSVTFDRQCVKSLLWLINYNSNSKPISKNTRVHKWFSYLLHVTVPTILRLTVHSSMCCSSFISVVLTCPPPSEIVDMHSYKRKNGNITWESETQHTNYVVVFLHCNTISSVSYIAFSWPGILSASSPSWSHSQSDFWLLLPGQFCASFSATSEWGCEHKLWCTLCLWMAILWLYPRFRSDWLSYICMTLWSWELGPNVTNNILLF